MKVYGPYRRKDGRKHVVVYEFGKIRQTISYPKFLMEQKLGRKLEPNETVDHINRDKTDDRIENLQVIEKGPHSAIDAKRVKDITLNCIWCGNAITRQPSKFNNRHDRIAGPFCSKKCIGKYGVEVQNGRVAKLKYVEIPNTEYFYLEKESVLR